MGPMHQAGLGQWMKQEARCWDWSAKDCQDQKPGQALTRTVQSEDSGGAEPGEARGLLVQLPFY